MLYRGFIDETKTLEELIEEVGQEAVFSGTEVDEATQNLLIDWLFDYKLCSDSDTKFLRYFRRRLNNVYPMYLSQVRVMTVRENLDPFVVHYFERLEKRQGTGTEATTRATTGNGTKGTTGGTTMSEGSVRTPDLVHANEYASQDDITSSDISDTTRTPNLTQSTTYGEQIATTGSGTDNTTRTPNLTDTDKHTGTITDAGSSSSSTSGTSTEDSTIGVDASNSSTSYSDAFAIQYPEANIGGSNLSVSLNGTRAGGINYAQSESIGGSKTDGTSGTDTTTDIDRSESSSTQGTTGNTRTFNNTDTSTHTGTETNNRSLSNTGNETHSGTDSTQSTGTEHTSTGASGAVETKKTGNDRSTDTGTETFTKTGTTTNSGEETTTNSQNEVGTANRSNDEKVQTIEKGRDESVADLIPRVMKALQNSNELLWLVKSLEVCFDCFS